MFSYWYLLPTIFLSPVLLKQGKDTRAKALRLPEPLGERQGIVGQGHCIKLLILGDSAGAGVGVEHQKQALSGQVSKRLAKTHQLEWSLIAKSGHTTADTIKLLNTLDKQNFETVLISLGVNDITSLIRRHQWKSQCERLVDLLQTKFSTQRIIWSDVPNMEKFPALPQPLRWVIGQRKNQMRATLLEFINEQENVELLEFPDILSDPKVAIQDWIASDGFHPGHKVYAIWAEAFIKLLLENRNHSG